VTTTSVHTPTAPFDDLAATLRGDLVRPGDADYDAARAVYTRHCTAASRAATAHAREVTTMPGHGGWTLTRMTTARRRQPTLTRSKVVLRPWEPADADAVFAACQDVEIQRWTTVPSPYSRADAVRYVSEVAPATWDHGGAVFAVIEAATGELAGSIGAHGMTDGMAHVGYWTAPAARGRGLTSDALRTLTGWLLRDAGAARVELIVEPANVGSVRVAKAAGFTHEGLLRQRLVLRGRRVDVAMFSMLTSDPAAVPLVRP
jgi:RimJ/RimL family protein N-acetyltransferase